jgi:hypothetical protein
MDHGIERKEWQSLETGSGPGDCAWRGRLWDDVGAEFGDCKTAPEQVGAKNGDLGSVPKQFGTENGDAGSIQEGVGGRER